MCARLAVVKVVYHSFERWLITAAIFDSELGDATSIADEEDKIIAVDKKAQG